MHVLDLRSALDCEADATRVARTAVEALIHNRPETLLEVIGGSIEILGQRVNRNSLLRSVAAFASLGTMVIESMHEAPTYALRWVDDLERRRLLGGSCSSNDVLVLAKLQLIEHRRAVDFALAVLVDVSDTPVVRRIFDPSALASANSARPC